VLPGWRNQIARGTFHTIRQWLIENVHRYGNLYDPVDLIKKITGEESTIKHYLNYLNDKYSELYGF
jgi:carboxypeptidase Taq